MQIYCVQISTPKYHLIFGAWRDEMQAKGWIESIKRIQESDYGHTVDQEGDYDPNIVEKYFQEAKKILSEYVNINAKKMFFERWTNAEVENVLDLFQRNPIIIALEIHDEFYQESLMLENRLKKNAQIK